MATYRAFYSRHLDLVRRLTDGDMGTLQAVAAQEAASAVDHLRAIELRQLGEDLARQHVAAVGALVAQDAVVKQVDADAAARAEERRVDHPRARQRLAGLGEIYVPGQLRKNHRLADLTHLVE